MAYLSKLAAPATGKFEALAKGVVWGIIANPGVWLVGYVITRGSF